MIKVVISERGFGKSYALSKKAKKVNKDEEVQFIDTTDESFGSIKKLS